MVNVCRSITIEKYEFYINQKALLHDVIMYHLPVQPERLRLAIATFAVDVDVKVDGISERTSQITKCDIFNNDASAYWNDVIFKVTYMKRNGTYILDYKDVMTANVDEALLVVDRILTSGNTPSAAEGSSL